MRRYSNAAIAAAALVLPGVAHADMFGGDLPLLTGILTQATSTVSQLSSMLQAAKASYDQMKQMAGYAADAADAYRQFTQLNSALFKGDLAGTLEQAFPEAAALRDEASRDASGGWLQGNGQLRRMVNLCVSTGNCAQAQDALSFDQTRRALSTAFGLAPTSELAAADNEAAVAISASSAQEGRGAVDRAYASDLMKECQSHGGKTNLASCQAAAAAAQIAAVQQNADVADAVAQGNRLQALQLELKGEERKRELLEAQQRRDVLVEGAQEAASAPPRVETEGFDALGESLR
jgi:uncharacterized phage infection (PIP) family protein YhgE